MSIIDGWLSDVRCARLCGNGSAEQLAAQNMLTFRLTSTEAKCVSVDELDEFLGAAFREYALQLARFPGPFWFYAWHDELAAALRTCAVRVERPDDLPFSCRLNIIDNSSVVASEFLRSKYLDGIPHEEFVRSSHEGSGTDVVEYTLDVFARRLPTVSFASDSGDEV